MGHSDPCSPGGARGRKLEQGPGGPSTFPSPGLGFPICNAAGDLVGKGELRHNCSLKAIRQLRESSLIYTTLWIAA